MQIEISEFESESPRDQGEVETTDLVVTGAEEEGPLLRPDMVEFLAAFLIGATIGVGALLLLRPAPETGRARVKKSLRPYQRKIRKDLAEARESFRDRKSTRLNSSHVAISYAVFCLQKKRPT